MIAGESCQIVVLWPTKITKTKTFLRARCFLPSSLNTVLLSDLSGSIPRVPLIL